MQAPIDPNHESTRTGLTALGGLLLVVGGILALVGLVDFFTSFSNPQRGFPTLFWCAFIGLPMVAIGGKILFFGNVGRIVRYMSQEVSPVGTDTFNYAVGETKDSIRDVAQAMGEGLGLRGDPATTARCTKCGHANAPDAQFCASCGQPRRTQLACSQCGHENAADARFCDQCGKPL